MATMKLRASESSVDLSWGVQIPMRDGVRLHATVYRPKDPQPTPVIFTLTPYIADSYHPKAVYFAQNGYAFVLVDCRGRGNSEGTFESYVNDGRDGHDVVEWLAVQPWCTGAVAMWGGSYAGFDQWMTLGEFPPHLRTIVPDAAAHAAVDTPFFNNIFYPYEIQWLTLVSGVTGNDKLFEDAAFWREKFLEHYRSHRPFKALDQTAGNPSPDFQTWLQHPTPDDYWDQMALTPAAYDHINVPILSRTGHYDTDQPGALHYYRAHMRSASPARDRHYLIIGPWDHAGASEFGGLKFDQASELDVNELHKAWYDWTLKDGPRPEFLKQRVAYYVAGAEEWKYADDLEGISNANLRLYLNSANGQANDVFHSGTLDEAPPGAAQPDRYVYDPLDVRFGELERGEIDAYLADQCYALNLFGNGLVYHSAPFAEEVDISGCVKLVAWIAIDVPDTDFQATLSEIRFDGSHVRLTQDMLRARYRESLRQEKLVIPGQINCYTLTGFTFFSRRIAKGSRLRLVISCPNSIYLEKNYNSGGVVAEESGEDARTAHVTLYHDAEHVSHIDLPLAKQP